jgi:hypothetical protein
MVFLLTSETKQKTVKYIAAASFFYADGRRIIAYVWAADKSSATGMIVLGGCDPDGFRRCCYY